MNFSLYVERGGRLNEAMELHKKSELGQKKK
jgi:hypothetical protein